MVKDISQISTCAIYNSVECTQATYKLSKQPLSQTNMLLYYSRLTNKYVYSILQVQIDTQHFHILHASAPGNMELVTRSPLGSGHREQSVDGGCVLDTHLLDVKHLEEGAQPA